MIRARILFVLALLSMIFACTSSKDQNSVDTNYSITEYQLKKQLEVLGDTNINPRCVNEDGTTRLVKSKDWTSGFFPGCLWFQYEYSGDDFWKQAAQKYTENIEQEQYNGRTHDMGFKMYCSYGAAYRLTNNPEYKEVLIQSAKTLSTRFNKEVGCIRSWDHNSDKWQFPVIVDNMMNLELLFWASKETRDSLYYKIAVSHANTTMRNHFREDESSYHVINYDKLTGEVLDKHTHQGYAHESAWARGQTWGFYGFTMCYRETGDERYLNQAKKIADYVIGHKNLPEDEVMYWDFDDPDIPNAPRDASAAAVFCSALYEFSLYIDDKEGAYKAFADKLYHSLSSSKYLANKGENNYFILEHSVGNMPKNDEVDKPIVYADYYFMEAGLRKMKLENNSTGNNPHVILKLDDLTYVKETTVHPQWQRVVDFAEKEQVDVTIGIITNSLEYGGDDYFNWVKKYHDLGNVEFWNHGYDHKRFDLNGNTVSEFFGTDYSHQYELIEKSQSLAEDKLGFRFRTFGAPYNWVDTNTSKVMAQFPEIDVWFYPGDQDMGDSEILILKRIKALNLEYPVHQPRFYDLWNNLYFHRNNKVLVLQGHPKSWDDERFTELARIIHYLKANNYTITTACKYYDSL